MFSSPVFLFKNIHFELDTFSIRYDVYPPTPGTMRDIALLHVQSIRGGRVHFENCSFYFRSRATMITSDHVPVTFNNCEI